MVNHLTETPLHKVCSSCFSNTFSDVTLVSEDGGQVSSNILFPGVCLLQPWGERGGWPGVAGPGEQTRMLLQRGNAAILGNRVPTFPHPNVNGVE